MTPDRRVGPDAAGGFGLDAVPVRPAAERDAAREREERIHLVVERPRRGLRGVLGVGAVLLVLVVVLLLVWASR